MSEAELLAFFKAMANESRLRIVGLLAQRERTVQELAETLSLKEPTVSHHLAVLKDLGLVTVRPDGVMRWHALDAQALATMNRRLVSPDEVAALVPEESWESRVLAGFLDAEGRLKVVPASRRKRWVILQWLVEQFDEDLRYPEAEVNATLQRRHWDSATLRRELIGAAMMAREAGVYWRLPRSAWRSYADTRPEPS